MPLTGSNFNGEPQFSGTPLCALLAGLPHLFCAVAGRNLVDGGTRGRALPQVQRPIPAPGSWRCCCLFEVATAAGSGDVLLQSDMTMMLLGQASSVIFSSSKTGNSDMCRLEHTPQHRIPHSQISDDCDDSPVALVLFRLVTRVVKT